MEGFRKKRRKPIELPADLQNGTTDTGGEQIRPKIEPATADVGQPLSGIQVSGIAWGAEFYHDKL